MSHQGEQQVFYSQVKQAGLHVLSRCALGCLPTRCTCTRGLLDAERRAYLASCCAPVLLRRPGVRMTHTADRKCAARAGRADGGARLRRPGQDARLLLRRGAGQHPGHGAPARPACPAGRGCCFRPGEQLRCACLNVHRRHYSVCASCLRIPDRVCTEARRRRWGACAA